MPHKEHWGEWQQQLLNVQSTPRGRARSCWRRAPRASSAIQCSSPGGASGNNPLELVLTSRFAPQLRLSIPSHPPVVHSHVEWHISSTAVDTVDVCSYTSLIDDGHDRCHCPASCCSCRGVLSSEEVEATCIPSNYKSNLRFAHERREKYERRRRTTTEGHCSGIATQAVARPTCKLLAFEWIVELTSPH